MAEFLAVVGVVSNVASIIQISGQVLTACYAYCQAVHDAEKDIIRVISVVSSLKGVLEDFHNFVDAKPNQTQPPHLESLVEALQGCDVALQELAREVGIAVERKAGTDQIKLRFRMKLTWPFNGKDVGNILQIIENHKATFILSLAGNTLLTTMTIEDTVTEISASMQN